MDSDLCRAFNSSISRRTARLDPGARDAPEWKGTGLCAEAQADGVPCSDVGRSCDVCERAVGQSAGAQPRGGDVRRSGTEI
jgi:hypothetical protein